MDDKFILDATSSWRQMWIDKNHPNVLYCDRRSEEEITKAHTDYEKQRQNSTCTPLRFLERTVKADFRHLDFPDETFRLIVFDPPHLRHLGAKSMFRKKYGALNPETWQSDLRKGAAELWRVLQPFGVLIFKWADHDISSEEVLKLFPHPPLFGQLTKKSRRSKGGPFYHTRWFCFMKIPEGATPEHKQGYVMAAGQLELTVVQKESKENENAES